MLLLGGMGKNRTLTNDMLLLGSMGKNRALTNAAKAYVGNPLFKTQTMQTEDCTPCRLLTMQTVQTLLTFYLTLDSLFAVLCAVAN